MTNSIAYSAAEIFSPRTITGEVVNVHVVQHVPARALNFDAMQRLIAGDRNVPPVKSVGHDAEDRNVSKNF